MRYAILSDIHANAAALRKVLGDVREQKADKVVCLGDVVGYGPDPVGALALCRESCDVVLMGNHDAAVAGVVSPAGFIPYAQDGVRRHRELLSATERGWLGLLPFEKRYPGFVCAHGSIEHPERFGYIIDTQSVIAAFVQLIELRRRVLFVGHTHHACVYDYDIEENRMKILPADELKVLPRHRYIVNVGSVGYPRVDCRSTYVLYDTETKLVRYRDLAFDYPSYVQELQSRNIDLPAWLAEQLEERRENGMLK